MKSKEHKASLLLKKSRELDYWILTLRWLDPSFQYYKSIEFWRSSTHDKLYMYSFVLFTQQLLKLLVFSEQLIYMETLMRVESITNWVTFKSKYDRQRKYFYLFNFAIWIKLNIKTLLPSSLDRCQANKRQLPSHLFQAQFKMENFLCALI